MEIKKPPKNVCAETVALAFGREVRILSYADGSIRFRVKDAAPMRLAEAFLTGEGKNVIVKLEPTSLPFDPQDVLDTFAEEIGQRLINDESLVNSKMAETNADGYHLDDYYLDDSTYDAAEGLLTMMAIMNFPGDQREDHIPCGSKVTARVKVEAELDEEGSWKLRRFKEQQVKTDADDDSWRE